MRSKKTIKNELNGRFCEYKLETLLFILVLISALLTSSAFAALTIKNESTSQNIENDSNIQTGSNAIGNSSNSGAANDMTNDYPDSALINETADAQAYYSLTSKVLAKDSYSLGEIISFNLAGFDLSDIQIFISFDEATYKYLGEPSSEIFFSPKKTGNYVLEIFSRLGAPLYSKSFSVLDVQSEQPKISIARSTYFMEDEILIMIGPGSLDSYSLALSLGSREYQFLGLLRPEIIFVPRESGDYVIYLSKQGNMVDQEYFIVLNSSQPEINRSVQLNETFQNVTLIISNGSVGQNDSGNFSTPEIVKSISPVVRITGIGDQNLAEAFRVIKNDKVWRNVLTNETYDIEIDLSEKRLISSIIINDVRFKENQSLDVTIEDIQQNVEDEFGSEESQTLQKAYSLDFEGFDNLSIQKPTAIINAVAMGNQLYRCDDWDSQFNACISSWKKVMDIIPGSEYSLEVPAELTGYAETGVASVNTLKSMYHPGEPAIILMVVLDTQGHLVHEADVDLEITSPSGRSYNFATSDKSISEEKSGIYNSSFAETFEEGNYSMLVHAQSELVNSSMLSYFAVSKFYEFDILRDAPVTIDPWIGQFKSAVTITSFTGAKTFSVVESVPSDYSIQNPGGSIVTLNVDGKINTLRWDNVVDGQTLGYSAQAPLKTPDLVHLGKIKIIYGGKEFEEARSWYLAVDPPVPYSIAGTIFRSDNITQVPLYTNFMINETNSSFLLRSYTRIPVPGQSGRYSETIQGNIGDLVRLTAWNDTSYGEIEVNLTGNMNNVNYNLSYVRPPETNVTIINLQNSSVVNISLPFQLVTSIGILGGQQCQDLFANVTISNANVINFSSGETTYRNLGAVNYGITIYPNWTLFAAGYGSADITVFSSCSNEGRRFYNTYAQTVYNINVDDRAPPVINLTYPLNGSWLNFSSYFFNYNITQEYTGVDNCTIYLDGNRNYTNWTIPVGQVQNFSMGYLSAGSHNWSISCFDNSSNLNFGSSETRFFNVERIAPNVTLLAPQNGFNTSFNNLSFSYNASDSPSGIDNCSLIIDGISVFNDSSVEENISQNFSVFVNSGFHNWTVLCYDMASNLFIAEPRYFNISNPDLYISSSHISFSNDTPVGTQLINISATIFNLGSANATNVTAQFFLNRIDDPMYQIGVDQTFNLSAGSNSTINISWSVEPGLNFIFVQVDPPLESNGSIYEGNESNNLANNSLYLTSWQWYYGTSSITVLLDTSSNLTISSWSNDTNKSYNLYVLDSDNSISWLGLKPIGKNLSNNLSTNDFEEIDLKLNISGFNDSTQNIFSDNGIPLHTTDMTLYNVNISGIPVTNNSAAGNFFTGILWDSSDTNPGEYNGSQDLVFITQRNKNSLGRFGTYDYEIRIPYTLKNYTQPNVDDLVSIYIEIT